MRPSKKEGRDGEVTRVPPYWSWTSQPEQLCFQGQIPPVNVAIIGGGLTGLSAAYHLLKRCPGARIVVLEANRLGAGASGRSTGMLSPGVGQSVASLVRRLGVTRARRLYEQTIEAVTYAAALIDQLGMDCELQMSGQLIVGRSPVGKQRVRQQLELLRRLGLPAEELSEQALSNVIRLQDWSANLSATEGPAALRLPNAGVVHPLKLVHGFASRIRELAGQIFEQAHVRSIHPPTRPGHKVRLELDGGEVLADKVVVATSGYTSQLGLFRGRLLPVHLQALVTEPLSEAALSAIGWDGCEGVLDARRLFSYFRLTSDKRVVFGGGRPRYCWGGALADLPSQSTLALLADELKQTFPVDSQLVVAGGWSGTIGYVIDALPAIAALPSCPQIVHAVGWCGHGIALSIASGSWIQKLLSDGVPPEDLPWFRATMPMVPTELARWIGFRASIEWMALLDRMS